MPPTNSCHAGARRPRNRALPCLRPWNPPCSLAACCCCGHRDRLRPFVQGKRDRMEENLEGTDVQEIAAFLGRFPPFTELDPRELAAVAAVARVERYSEGEDILIED